MDEAQIVLSAQLEDAHLTINPRSGETAMKLRFGYPAAFDAYIKQLSAAPMDMLISDDIAARGARITGTKFKPETEREPAHYTFNVEVTGEEACRYDYTSVAGDNAGIVELRLVSTQLTMFAESN